MEADGDGLRALNVDVEHAEARGDKTFFDELLAPAFAMRRADGKRVDDRERFLVLEREAPASSRRSCSTTVPTASPLMTTFRIGNDHRAGGESGQN